MNGGTGLRVIFNKELKKKAVAAFYLPVPTDSVFFGFHPIWSLVSVISGLPKCPFLAFFVHDISF